MNNDEANTPLPLSRSLSVTADAIGRGVAHVGQRLDDSVGRGNRSLISRWFWELDRVLLVMIIALIAMGLLAVGAGSPASAERLSTELVKLEPMYFLWRQMIFLAIGVPVMLLISMLPPDPARRLAIVGFIGCVSIMMLLPLIGTEINGAKRWFGVGALRFQPSEFMKPFFAVTMAWLFALKIRHPHRPMILFAGGITFMLAVLLMLQPDLGQTIIVFAMFGVLLLISGVDMKWIWGLGAAGTAALTTAYFTYSVAKLRIDQWLFGGVENDQIDLAHKALTAGGLTGVGTGLGTRKFSLPEAHTDYVFSVIGEEYGLLVCGVIAAAFFVIVMRVLMRLQEERDPFVIYATAALITQFGGQALINMMVNLRLFPSKGMTLPFISYGGSSLIALCVTVGLLLAFTKRNPWLTGHGMGHGMKRQRL